MTINWENIGNISSVFTIVSFIVCILSNILSFTIGLKFKKIKRLFRKRKALKNIEDSGVLIIGINETKNPEISVKKFLKKDVKLKKIPNSKIHLLFLTNSDNSIEKKDVEKIKKDIEQKLTIMSEQGILIKHLFLMCPVSIASIIGAELSNIGKTFVYQLNDGRYELWGDLSKY